MQNVWWLLNKNTRHRAFISYFYFKNWFKLKHWQREKYSGEGGSVLLHSTWISGVEYWIKPTSGAPISPSSDFIILILRAKPILSRCCIGCSLFYKQNELNWKIWEFKRKSRPRKLEREDAFLRPKLVKEVAPLQEVAPNK